MFTHRFPVHWVLMVAAVGFAAGAWAERAAAERRARPNFVWIIADDQAYTDFGFMGNHLVQTPHLDRLAEQSARFPRGYLPASVCRPSLASLLTGLYQHQHQIHFNHPPHKLGAARHEADYLIRRVRTLPRMLKRAGYTSFQTGKFWEGHYRNAGFDEGMTLGGEHWIMPALGWRKAHGNGDAGLLIGRRTMQPIADFLDCHGEEPFFLWYAPVLPHTPHNVAEKYLKPYRDNPEVPELMVRYYASITRFDDTVGQLMSMLRQRHLVRNTLFVFVVDNGWLPNPSDPSRLDPRTKTSPYEFGVRTPVLLRWDGHIKPATHRELVSSLDWCRPRWPRRDSTRSAAGCPASTCCPPPGAKPRCPSDRCSGPPSATRPQSWSARRGRCSPAGSAPAS